MGQQLKDAGPTGDMFFRKRITTIYGDYTQVSLLVPFSLPNCLCWATIELLTDCILLLLSLPWTR